MLEDSAHHAAMAGNERSTGAPRKLLNDSPIPKLLFVTSEMTDFVKVGGLGEVSAALPRALRQSHDIRVLIPGYRQVLTKAEFSEVARLPATFGFPACSLGRADMADGLVVYALICPDLFDREGSVYGDGRGSDWPDNDMRFGRLGLAGAEIARGLPDLGWKPDLVHVNDWPASMTPAYLSWWAEPVPTLLTIHNLAYQGLFERERMHALGVPENAFDVEGVEFYGRVSFLKSGIYYASHITTVSRTYAEEITTPEFGCGLDGLLRTRAGEGRLSGIINGVDESWDAGRDPLLPSPFSPANLSGRRASAAEVRESFRLAVSRGPLFAIISRLVHQKGIDLAIEAIEGVVAQGGQIAVMGRGEAQYETALEELARKYPGSVGVRLGFDETQARRLYAGGDFLLMPSRFEPCGLSQMYAQRYGSLPIAYKTGGLAETIEDGVTGFLFSDFSLAGLRSGIDRAFHSFSSKQRLNRMRRNAMRRTASWRDSARSYADLYERFLRAAGSTRRLA